MATSALTNKQMGFTLLEAMIVTVIIAILAGIAYPSYLEHVRKAKRADAEVSLMELAQFMERYYTANGRYLDASGNAPTLPFSTSPKDGGAANYNLAFASGSPSASAYTLQATPTNGMTGDMCGTLTLTNTGAKGQGTGGTLAGCWRR